MKKVPKRLIDETLQLIRWKIFLGQEVGLKYDLSSEELKEIKNLVLVKK